MASHSARASELSPEHVLLGLLEQRPAHGYELHQHLTRGLGSLWHLSQSQVYATLKRLEARGWVVGTPQTQRNLPDRRLLRLTPEGRRHLRSWLQTPTASSVRAIRVEFLTRLHFAARLGPEVVVQLIDEQAGAVQADLRRLDSNRPAASDSPIAVLAHDLRLRQLASVLPWLEECRRRLTQTEASGR